MNYEALKNNLIDVIKESQLKLGYSPNDVGIFYPLRALNNLLDEDLDVEGMKKALDDFSGYAKDTIGETSYKYSETEKRFGITVPAKGVKFIHESVEEPVFLKALLEKLYSGAKAADFEELFRSFSDNVHFEQIEDDEFDYLAYFPDGKPDSYRYCLSDDLGHVSYHRFTPKDFADLDIK
ncbi:DUF3877 family protein [Ruminococcus sp.]|uniref:DUF3877 family protein n=1 Tax=Ruminococcus sp. TaxID=41978 RepID=UPI0025F21685|nr:DUF3877 family protein [Ruminococcus sp.]